MASKGVGSVRHFLDPSRLAHYGVYDKCRLLVFASRNRYAMSEPSRSFAGGWDIDRTIERFENEPSRDAASAGGIVRAA
jgi:hypothetical protein